MIIEIGDKLVSQELFTNEFVCNLSKCQGSCCVEGDSGAPLKQEELLILDEIIDKVKPYLTPEGISAIEKQGNYVLDKEDGEFVTPLINNKECAYVIWDEENTAKCGIEKAFLDKKIEYKKPISCHLYPIREKQLSEFTALNYDKWDICNPACELGKELEVKVYQFLKEPIVRAFGEEFYEELKIVEDEINQIDK